MRDIKFRGKTGTTEGKKWVYGYLYKIKSFFSEDYQYFIKNEHLQETSVDEDTIGQYTGSKDKNGKEIYEGDIVKVFTNKEWRIGKIIYEHSGFTIDVANNKELEYGRTSIIEKLVEVIGNIYDNPELLEEGE